MKNKIKFWLACCMLCWFSGAVSAQSIQLVGVFSHGGEHRLCVQVDKGNKQLKSLSIVAFSMRTGQNTILADMPVALDDSYYTFLVDERYLGDPAAYRVRAVFSDESNLRSEVVEMSSRERFLWIGTDVTWSENKSGFDGAQIDQSIGYHKMPFPVGGISFYKSFSTHTQGYFVFNFPEDTPYKRFFTHYGIQDNNSKGDLVFSFFVNGEQVESYPMYAMSNPNNTGGPFLRTFEADIQGETVIRIEGDMLDGNTEEDHMNFPMGRVYLKDDPRGLQSSDWEGEQILSSNTAFTHTLDASFSSGGKVFYRLISGNEYATIQDNMLQVHTIPTDKNVYLEVEAFQPGTDDYKPSAQYRKFYIRNNKVVQKNERLVIPAGEEVDELVIYGDALSMGQVEYAGGIPRVDRLVLKYTFVPGKWNFITFPANLNIDEISDLNQLGYQLNQAPKAYYLCEYDTKKRAEEPSAKAWSYLRSPLVQAGKGYLMGVARTPDGLNNPVEVTFVIDNTELEITPDKSGTSNVMLDFTQVEPDDILTLYIKPDGVKGNTLRLDVKFDPTDLSKLPLDYGRALREARVTFNPNRSGIRLTLPTDDPAKVLLFDSSGKLVKAVRYVAPYLIDIQTLQPGEYKMLIEYGGCQDSKTFQL